MNSNEVRAFIEKVSKEVWEDRNPEKIVDFYSKDVVAHMGSQDVGYADIENRCRLNKARFSKIDNQIVDIITKEDKGMFRAVQTATPADGGEDEVYNFIAIYHFKNGKVQEMWMEVRQPIDYLK